MNTETAKARAEELIRHESAAYRDKCEPFFSYLEKKQGEWNGAQFKAFREFFLYHAWFSEIAVGKILSAAYRHLDFDAVHAVSRHARAFAGADYANAAILNSTISTLNRHGELVFKVAPCAMDFQPKSFHGNSDMEKFVAAQSWCFDNLNYRIALGAYYAQCFAPSQELEKFFNSFLAPYTECYAGVADFHLVEVCFIQKSTVLGDYCRDTLWPVVPKHCFNQKNLNDVVMGVRLLLKAQSDLWLGLHQKLVSWGGPSGASGNPPQPTISPEKILQN
jgi:hypothetical protein